MREIKFRAKTCKGEWVEGLLFKLFFEGMWCIGNEPLQPNDYSEIIGQNRDWFEIIPETICQYTGLKDKNGKEIWENDIVCFQFDNDNCTLPYTDTKKRYGKIFFSDYRASFAIAMGRNGSKSMNNDLYKYVQCGNRVEVIGNIFDNPELLERGAE
jgi:uncharacterized phage protein (TIGR01671 family)